MSELINKRIAPYYKITRITTSMIDEDVKTMKRINTLLQKLEKTGKQQYILETLNILRSLNNSLRLSEMYLIFCELIDFQYHDTIEFLLKEIVNLEKLSSVQLTKKLQELASNDY